MHVTDFRFWCLATALAAMLLLFSVPTQRRQGAIYHVAFVVDITRSMNVEDYRWDGRAQSRLAAAKRGMTDALGRLPCGSTMALGIFTERRAVLLYQPVEVCSGAAELRASIAALDWRMAWAADSRIGHGVASALQLALPASTALLFLTDGQEAPPVNPRYAADLPALRGQRKGMLVGVGGMQPMAIPKFDAQGRRTGVYSADDVPHRSSFGESNLNPQQIEGYDARNAPFGRMAASGAEHLSALREDYLQRLADQAGLGYRRLNAPEDLYAMIADSAASSGVIDVDVRPYEAGLALLAVLLMLV